MDEFDLHKEPEFPLSPLPIDKYCDLYDIEMVQFDHDFPFYLQRSKPKGDVLELGCGTGRVAKQFAKHGFQVTGIDNSLPMLQKAIKNDKNSIHYINADITNFFLQHQFDTIIIPYNTLNLLADITQVKRCLCVCRKLIKNSGALLIQLFIPDHEILQAESKRIFQFQIFKQSANTTIIKETLKLYQKKRNKLILEERYRLRTNINGTMNRDDYNHFIHLIAMNNDEWLQALNETGFHAKEQYGSYDFRPYIPSQDNCLLLAAYPKS